MLDTLESVVERLIDGYQPDRIILFGSRATGAARDGSDIDLVIVKETDQRPIDRRVEVEGLLSDRRVPLDLLVYTPRELRELYAAGDPFIVTVVETGRVLYMRKATAAWVREAREGLESAAILLDHAKHRGACLHSQQAVERGLKALILECGRPPAPAHDIVELLRVVEAEGFRVGLPMDDAVFLNSVYRGRYPTEAGLLPPGEPTAEDAGRALRAAERVVGRLESLLKNVPP